MRSASKVGKLALSMAKAEPPRLAGVSRTPHLWRDGERSQRKGPHKLRRSGAPTRGSFLRDVAVLLHLARPRVVLLALPFLAAGGVLAVACGFPDVTFGAEDASTSEATTNTDGAANDLDGGGGGGDARADADAADAPMINAVLACPSLCADAGVGSCDIDGTCLIACVAAGTCTDPVVCPAGIPCNLTCTGAGSCTGTIDCNGASACKINCIGAGACTQRITCKGSKCSVVCNGAGTCTGPIVCNSPSCDVRCKQPDSCAQAITCTGSTCAVDCAGARACKGDVTSNAADTNVSCTGMTSCAGRVSCTGTSCNANCSGVPSCIKGVCCDAGTCTGMAPPCL